MRNWCEGLECFLLKTLCDLVGTVLTEQIQSSDVQAEFVSW